MECKKSETPFPIENGNPATLCRRYAGVLSSWMPMNAIYQLNPEHGFFGDGESTEEIEEQAAHILFCDIEEAAEKDAEALRNYLMQGEIAANGEEGRIGAETPQNRACVSCRWYWAEYTEGDARPPYASCRRYPPAMSPHSFSYSKKEKQGAIACSQRWPIVLADDFCGEWEPIG